MIKQSLITITTLGLLSVSALAVDTKACLGCHGKDFEKKAMGMSKIVKDMTKDEIVASLKGYQEGKGGKMKALMKGQVAKLSDADIETMAVMILGEEKKEAPATDANATKAEDNSTKKTEDNTTKKVDAKPAVEVNTAACVGCHGKDFEKKALNVSKIVKDMTKADIVASLKGYKEGKGGAMKAVMLGQVKALTDEQMNAIAEKFGK